MIRNKFEKFLVGFSGFLLAGLAMLGFKTQADAERIQQLSVVPDPQDDFGFAAQEKIRKNRDKKLNAAAHAPLEKSNTQTTIKTVIPGKTITQTVPAETAPKTTTTKSSSSKKKTKSS